MTPGGGTVSLAEVISYSARSSPGQPANRIWPRSAPPRSALPRSALPRSALPRSALPRSALPRSALPRSALPRPAPRPGTSSARGLPAWPQRSTVITVVLPQ
jgi:hypothetical protein